jgi:CBS domain-containing protein
MRCAETISINASMRDALTALLRTGCDALPVLSEDGSLAGEIDLATVRAQLRREPEPEAVT